MHDVRGLVIVCFGMSGVVSVSSDDLLVGERRNTVSVDTCSSCDYKTDPLDDIHSGCQTKCVSCVQVGTICVHMISVQMVVFFALQFRVATCQLRKRFGCRWSAWSCSGSASLIFGQCPFKFRELVGSFVKHAGSVFLAHRVRAVFFRRAEWAGFANGAVRSRVADTHVTCR